MEASSFWPLPEILVSCTVVEREYPHDCTFLPYVVVIMSCVPRCRWSSFYYSRGTSWCYWRVNHDFCTWSHKDRVFVMLPRLSNLAELWPCQAACTQERLSHESHCPVPINQRTNIQRRYVILSHCHTGMCHYCSRHTRYFSIDSGNLCQWKPCSQPL